MNKQEKRVIAEETKKCLCAKEIILIAVLLAAGAVLKFFVGSLVNIGGMKPNFVIAMYCLAILLVRPRVYESVIIGVLAGAICKLFPGTPYLNFASEIAGALVMGLLIFVPMNIKKFSLQPIAATFISTVVSGSIYTVLLFVVTNAEMSAMAAYVPIVFFTAVFNSIIVQVLYLPLTKVLKK